MHRIEISPSQAFPRFCSVFPNFVSFSPLTRRKEIFSLLHNSLFFRVHFLSPRFSMKNNYSYCENCMLHCYQEKRGKRERKNGFESSSTYASTTHSILYYVCTSINHSMLPAASWLLPIPVKSVALGGNQRERERGQKEESTQENKLSAGRGGSFFHNNKRPTGSS